MSWKKNLTIRKFLTKPIKKDIFSSWEKSFVGKELTELQRTYEALEEVTSLSREVLRELKLKDKILNYESETII